MLRRKMLRDIWVNKGSYLACLVIAGIGLMVFASFSIVAKNLVLAKDTFYSEQNFADGFIELASMPASALERLSRVEGIREISGRVVREVAVHTPGSEESVYLRLVSLDLSDPQRVNDVRLLAGTALTDGALNVWVDNQFFDAHQLEPGSAIEVVAGGRLHQLTVLGAGMSPEFTYPLRTGADLFPNPEQFGIAFIPLGSVPLLFPDMRGRINNVVFTLEPGAAFDEVKEKLAPELSGYGLLAFYSREEQLSHMMLSEQITGMEAISGSLPLLFLCIAAFILYIMLKRLVEQQRGQIGILKACGYTDREIAGHYLSYALAVGAAAGLLGGALGMLLATPLTALVFAFFNTPEVYEGFSLSYLLQGVLMSLAVFLVSGYNGCKFVLQLKPAEAMRPPAPVSGRKMFVERIAFLSALLTVQGKMALRNAARNRGRSAFLFCGITLCCAVVAMTWSLHDLYYKLVFYQYEEVEIYDARIILAGPVARKPAQRELEGLAGVTRVEPLLEVPATLSHRWREESVPVLGIARESTLYNILDAAGNRIAPAGAGLILSERLAAKLGVAAGAVLEMRSPFLRGEEPRAVEVFAIIPQYLGMNAYMELAALEELLGQGEFATSFLVSVAGGAGGVAALRDHYRESDAVAGVDGREERIRKSRELLEAFSTEIYLYVFVGVIVGFSIIYSSSFIILSERSRELASMRVLGMTEEEVFSVITLEQWFISAFAILAGLPLGQLMQRVMAVQMSSDLYSLPGKLTGQSLIAAVVITTFSIWFAQRFVLKKVRQLSLVEVLKSTE